MPAAYAGEDGLPPIDTTRAADIPGSADGHVHLDADVTLPDPARTPPPAGGYPLIVLMHGCCAAGNAAFLTRRARLKR